MSNIITDEISYVLIGIGDLQNKRVSFKIERNLESLRDVVKTDNKDLVYRETYYELEFISREQIKLPRVCYSMFAGLCMRELDLSNVDWSEAKILDEMFQELDVHKLVLGDIYKCKPTSVKYMFDGMTSKSVINISSIDLSRAVGIETMFTDDSNFLILPFKYFYNTVFKRFEEIVPINNFIFDAECIDIRDDTVVLNLKLRSDRWRNAPNKNIYFGESWDHVFSKYGLDDERDE